MRFSVAPSANEIEVTRSGLTFGHLDGHGAVGNLVAYEATKVAFEKAKSARVAVVEANGFCYSGNLAYYAEMATRENLIVFIASNGTPIVAPHGGYEPKVCTNSFCIGFPTNEPNQPIIWDIGTSNIMYAQVKLAERLGTSMPEGSAYGCKENLTTDPLEALQGPLSVWGGHEGSGLAIMVQLLGIAAGSTEPTPRLSDSATWFWLLILAFLSLWTALKDMQTSCHSLSRRPRCFQARDQRECHMNEVVRAEASRRSKVFLTSKRRLLNSCAST